MIRLWKNNKIFGANYSSVLKKKKKKKKKCHQVLHHHKHQVQAMDSLFLQKKCQFNFWRTRSRDSKTFIAVYCQTHKRRGLHLCRVVSEVTIWFELGWPGLIHTKESNHLCRLKITIYGNMLYLEKYL